CILTVDGADPTIRSGQGFPEIAISPVKATANHDSSMSSEWADKVVFITGASSGISRALGIELARRGAGVGLLARRSDVLSEIVGEIEKTGGRALALPADVTHSE